MIDPHVFEVIVMKDCPGESLMGKIEATENAAQRIEYVALSRLTLSQFNVRKKAPTGIDALSATIGEKGLPSGIY